MIISGIVIIYLGKKKGLPNTYLWALFAIFHGFHEFIDYLETFQPPFIIERFGMFLAISSSFSLLAVTIELNGAIAQPIGKLVALIGISTAGYFIFVLPEDFIEFTAHQVIKFGLLDIIIFRFFHGFFITLIAIFSILFSFLYLKWKSKRDLIEIDPKTSYLTLITVLLLSFYAFFEGFDFVNGLFIMFRAFSMFLILIVPLLFILDMSRASYFSNFERLRLERKLIKSEENFRVMLETSSIGLLEVDVKFNQISYANPMFLEMIGYPLNKLKTEEFLINSVIHPKDLQRIFKNSEEKKLEFRIYDSTGRIKWLLGKRVNHYNEKGELTKFRLWVDAITKKREQDKLLKEIIDVKSELLKRTSHELKTPLVSIKGYTELLLDLYSTKFDMDVILNLKQIKEGSKRLEKIINNFFIASDLESSQFELKLSEENLSTIIRKSVKDIKEISQSRNQSFILNIQDNLFGKLEKEKIHEVLNHLLLNAVNNTPKHGDIRINSEIEDEFVVISIKDNDIGILEEEKQKLFTQFGKIERYGRGRDLGIDGIGLGLFISKKLVNLHGGQIWVESEGRDKGTTFHFSLPMNK